MTEQLLNKLLSLVPQLALIAAFLFALVLILKEYAKLRNEVKQAAEDVINARLGSLIGQIQGESAKAKELSDQMAMKATQVERVSDALMQAYAEKEGSFRELEERIQFLQNSLPRTAEQSKVPAKALIAAAQRAQTWQAAAGLIEKVRDDADATSKDLEFAGDRARDFRQYSLALDLYEIACRKDPENLSARVEHLCLAAESNYKGRDNSLQQAKELVVSSLNEMYFTRVCNTLVTLGRYTQLGDMCESVLAHAAERGVRPILAPCHRNLAVALKEGNDFEGAERHLRIALQASPHDENIVKAYFSLLRDQEKHEEALREAVRLVDLDPTDGFYHYITGSLLARLHRYEEAAEWLQSANDLATEDSSYWQSAQRELAIIHARETLQPRIEAIRGRAQGLQVRIASPTPTPTVPSATGAAESD